MENTITVPEAARRSGVMVHYVYGLLASGRLKGEKRDGRWLIDEADFERWRAAHKFYRKTKERVQ
jgi:excisionase family DNA binding protein